MSIKVCHFALGNGSGLNSIATSMVEAEKQAGLDSFLSYVDKPDTKVEGYVLPQNECLDADIGVCHAHLPHNFKGKSIFLAHGTPEHCFAVGVEQNKFQGYTAGDPMMMSLYQINHCDVTVTFWPRHEYIWKSMNPKADVRCIPMGVDQKFWQPIPIEHKWTGNPSVFICENSHQIKWPLDVILAFPLIMESTGAVLHMHYIPLDQHRFWYPLMQANGTLFRSYSSGGYFDSTVLRSNYCSADFYLSPVRYGDFNCTCLEAAACGTKVISYRGNEYAHYWITEGDQRVMAQELIAIFNGQTEPRIPLPAPDLSEMSAAMIAIYKELL